MLVAGLAGCSLGQKRHKAGEPTFRYEGPGPPGGKGTPVPGWRGARWDGCVELSGGPRLLPLMHLLLHFFCRSEFCPPR
jgi:hypothetical protein